MLHVILILHQPVYFYSAFPDLITDIKNMFLHLGCFPKKSKPLLLKKSTFKKWPTIHTSFKPEESTKSPLNIHIQANITQYEDRGEVAIIIILGISTAFDSGSFYTSD